MPDSIALRTVLKEEIEEMARDVRASCKMEDNLSFDCMSCFLLRRSIDSALHAQPAACLAQPLSQAGRSIALLAVVDRVSHHRGCQEPSMIVLIGAQAR